MESTTEYLLIRHCELLGFNCHPCEGNKAIFGKLKPDGYFVDNQEKMLIIFECKQKRSQYMTEAKEQLQLYIKASSAYAKKHNLDIMPVFCFGTTPETFTMLYVEDFNNLDDELTFDSCYTFDSDTLSTDMPSAADTTASVFNPHIFNQFIYDHFKSISINERLKLVVSVLLTIYSKTPLNEPLFQRVIEVETTYGFGPQFQFLAKTPYNTLVDYMFKFLSNVSREQIMECIYSCFAEISYWSFKGIQGKQTKAQIAQQEGAVLTPPYIVDLMINELDIKQTDSVCDPCCGTGNFLMACSKLTKFIMGDEFDETRSIIAKHGLIISGIQDPNIRFGDSMKNDYNPTFDWLLMNPPYDHHIEQSFCLKFIKSARKGGAVIIPKANFKDKSFIDQLAKISIPQKLIILNDKVFYESGITVETAIYSFRSIDNTAAQAFELYDFTNDGYIIQRGIGKVRQDNSSTINKPVFKHNINIKSVDWINSVAVDVDKDSIPRDELIKFIRCYNIDVMKQELDSYKTNYTLPIKLPSPPLDETLIPNTPQIPIKSFKLGDIFEFHKSRAITIYKTKPGNYPLISSTGENEGIKTFIDSYNVELECLTVAMNGTAGSTFYHNYKFSRTGDVAIIKFKQPQPNSEKLYRLFALFMNHQLRLKYSWGNKLSQDLLLNETINIPQYMLEDSTC